ncbi:hypothetical protein GCM10010140_77560 [Streptosporangium pseudovulgare]|uniref:Transposase IS204/IS1001/IS1096/IS1165 zinc-finger domain-containing protein n=1 Tax=Streptosporangium pseudovulgare TaxID=35765 RepID=A0ABQ2RMP5_9ACTN|nr:hypothetical protein GCM10010140_77560 [Streptosporangium pseudovulgare]
MHDLDELVNMVFSGLSPLVVEDVAGEDERIRVRARTPDGPATCPGCGAEPASVHDCHERSVAGVPIDARRVLVMVRIRRLVCPTRGCHQTFRERLPGVLERYQRRTPRLASQTNAMVRDPAGRAGAQVMSALTVWTTSPCAGATAPPLHHLGPGRGRPPAHLPTPPGPAPAHPAQ